MTNSHISPRRAHFSIVELLAVIAVMAILMSMLMPSLARARFQAKVTGCATTMSEWGIGLFGYASDHDQKFPNHHISASVGRNPWGIGRDFRSDMVDQGVDTATFSCTVNPFPESLGTRYEASHRMTMIGYVYLVPHNANNGPMVVSSIQSPARIGSSGNSDRPMLADTFVANASTPTIAINSVTATYSHRWNAHTMGRGSTRFDVINSNRLFHDGHVKTVSESEVALRQSLHLQVSF
jgi:competence protein ComGC